MEVDHKVPLWAGGEDADHNLQVLCIECHRDKTATEAGARAGGGECRSGLQHHGKPRAPHSQKKNSPFNPVLGDGP